jgi:hypothetical protein
MKNYRSELLACGLLLALTWVAFGHSLANDFVNYDDPHYVTSNWNVMAGLTYETIEWAFTTRVQSHWHPLTLLSLALDYEIWGLAPWGFHLTNLILHCANAVLLFLFLRRCTGSVWRSAVVAGLFAVHPLHVESVAWVTERKDMLSTFFMFVAMHAYLNYLAKPDDGRYGLICLAFALGLLAKPMVVTLPCVLLLVDYWPLRRWGWAGTETPAIGSATTFRRALVEKLPLFALSAISSLITQAGMRRGGVLKTLDKFSFADFLGHRLVMYVEYLRKMVWPNDLAIYYPMPTEPWPVETVLVAAVILGGITFLCLWQARRRPFLLVGWLWYLGTLFPVNGPFQVASYAMADRNSYVPLIGIFIATVWGVADVAPAAWRRPVLAPVASVVLIACGTATWMQVRVWENSHTLWAHALDVTDADKNYFAHMLFGAALRDEGKMVEARAHYEKAVRIWPEEPRLNFQLGYFLLSQNRYVEALPYLQRACAGSDALVRSRPNEVIQMRVTLAKAIGSLLLPTETDGIGSLALPAAAVNTVTLTPVAAGPLCASAATVGTLEMANREYQAAKELKLQLQR